MIFILVTVNMNTPMYVCNVLFSADFNQIVPVLTRGRRADEMNILLKDPENWHSNPT